MWNKFSIRIQLIVFMSLLVLVIESITLFTINNLQKIDSKKSAIDEIGTLTRSLNTDLIKVIFTPTADSFADITHSLSGFKKVDGLLLFDSNTNAIFKYKNITNLQEQKENIIKLENIFSSHNLLIKKSLIIDNYEAGFVLIDINLDEYTKRQEKILYSMLLILPISLILAIIISIFLSKSYTKPIIQLTKDIKELENLNLDININHNASSKEIKIAQDSLQSLKCGLDYFSKYMPLDLVKFLIRNNEQAKIGGTQKKLSIMFTDIENFTTISESTEPTLVTTQLSTYFELLTKIINKNEGTIDKFIGDSVMAFWGAPNEVENKIEKSIKTAIQIQQELNILNKKWESEGKIAFKTRIGIHFGKVIVGNIGSMDRMNYTIIGDNVNIASRLESINKTYNTNIMISEDVNNYIKDKFNTKFIDSIKLKGKNNITNIFTVEHT